MKPKKKGIKRHVSLQPLSRHHMEGLFVALKLSRAGTEASRLSTEQIVHDAKEFWQNGGDEHFREEEEILLPVYSDYADINDALIIEMLLEHVRLRAGMQKLMKNELTEAQMRTLGKDLEAHIRKEERVIFPMIEKALPEEKLIELQQYIYD